jgi:hypothetical protein
MLLCSLIAQTTLVWHPCHRGARNLRRHREDFPQAFLLQVRLGFHLSVLWPVVSEVVASSRMLCLPALRLRLDRRDLRSTRARAPGRRAALSALSNSFGRAQEFGG